VSYKDSITSAMTELGKDKDALFIGYGIRHGKAMGTLAGVRETQLLETPIAENLMVGLAIGLSLRGKKPVVFIERADFLLNALDAIVNHLVKIELMSRKQFKPACILRIIVGNKAKPLFTGETHTQDFMAGFRALVHEKCAKPMSVVRLVSQDPPDYIAGTFRLAHDALAHGHSTAVFEMKDDY
jgi:pyruvate/2-oxoglutarate/acetoin dehydrogenase E1 component